MKTRRDFLKRTALLGASAFIAPSLLGRESDGDCFFSQESTSSIRFEFYPRLRKHASVSCGIKMPLS